MLLQANLQDGVEALHVLGELSPAGVSQGSHSQHGLLVHSGMSIAEHGQQRLHDLVGVLQHRQFGGLLLSQLLDDHLQHATQQSLQTGSIEISKARTHGRLTILEWQGWEKMEALDWLQWSTLQGLQG